MKQNLPPGATGSGPETDGQYSSFPRGFAIWFLLCIATLFFISYWVTGKTNLLPTLEDQAEFQPYQRMAAAAWQGGQFPLWSCQLLSGFPLAGWPHSNVFYPFGFIFYFFDYNFASVINLCLHLFIFGLGLYIFLRALDLRPESALCASVICTFGPILSLWEWNFLPTILTGAWIPWLMAFSFRMIKSRKLINLLGIAISFGLQIPGGRYDLIVRELLLIGLMAAMLILWRRSMVKVIGLWIVGGLIGGLIVCAVVLMHQEYVGRSIRQIPLSFGYWSANQKDYEHLLTFFIWGLTPSVIISCAGLFYRWPKKILAYPALLVVILFLFWVVGPRFWLYINYRVPILNRLLWPGVTSDLAAIGMAMLSGAGLDYWLKRVPDKKVFIRFGQLALLFSVIYALFWWPGKVSPPGDNEYGITAFYFSKGKTASAIALGIVAIYFFAQAARKTELSRGAAGSLMAWTILLLTTVDVLLSGLVGSIRQPYRGLPQSPLLSRMEKPSYLPYRSLHFISWAKWRTANISAQSGSDPFCRSIDGFISLPDRRYAEFLSLLNPEVMKVVQNQIESERFVLGFKDDNFLRPESLQLLSYLNTKYFCVAETNIKFGPVYHLRFAEPEIFDGAWSSPKDEKIWRQEGAARFGFRFATGEGLRFQTGIKVHGEAPWMFQLLSSEKRGGKSRIGYARAIFQGGPGEKFEAGLDATLPDTHSRFYHLQGVSLPLAKTKGQCEVYDARLLNDQQPLKFDFQKDDTDVYVNPEAFPSIFIVHHVISLPQARDRLLYFSQHPERLRSEAVVERDLHHDVLPANPALEHVQIQKYSDQLVQFQAKLDRPGLLVTSDTSYPGWEAYQADGKSIPVMRVNHAFRGLWLPSGLYTIKMIFRPMSFRIGLWCSISSLFTALCLCILGFQKNKPPRPPAR